jgi:predicted  nucleic acid-binding Zn-ribbon protein
MLYNVAMDQELRQRADEIRIQISKIPHSRVRQDLERMFRVAEKMLAEISQEMVECRRLHRETARLVELQSKTRERLLQIEQYITMALLVIDR